MASVFPLERWEEKTCVHKMTTLADIDTVWTKCTKQEVIGKANNPDIWRCYRASAILLFVLQKLKRQTKADAPFSHHELRFKKH